MLTIRDELRQQPDALRALARHLRSDGEALLRALGPLPGRVILTGMGASFQAAWIAALRLREYGLPAMFIEASELATYATGLLADETTVLYVSQSGESPEVGDVAVQLGGRARLIAITNAPSSMLAQAAALTLPLQAGPERHMAAKTYSNSVALLWWLTERWVGREPELDRIEHLAERVALIQSNDGQTQWLLEAVDVGQGMALCGHGPHAATARYGAQLLAQWAKVPALDHSIAALRHGFIEMIEPGFSVVVVTSGQRASASRLLKDLHGYGARAIALQAGSAIAADAIEARTLDQLPPCTEYLSPVLDAVALQEYTLALAGLRGVKPGLRYMQKVVTRR